MFLPRKKLWVKKAALCLLFFLLCAYIAIFCIPVRNVVFHYHVERAWRNISSLNLFTMFYIKTQHPSGIRAKTECSIRHKPIVTRESINASKFITYNYDADIAQEALSRFHGKYLPRITVKQKTDVLYLFKTMKEVLDQKNTTYFLIDGIVLGVSRHGGFVPWDDDIDIAIPFDQWEAVKELLSCVEGFTLETFSYFHWKFHFENRSFPFLDLFLYSKTGPNIHALSHYIMDIFVYPEYLVFPLVDVDFEGVHVPMPRHSLELAKNIYNFSECWAHPGHVNVTRLLPNLFPNGYSKERVPCKDLRYMYSMTNLDLEPLPKVKFQGVE